MFNRIWSNVKGLNLKKKEEMEYKAYIVLSKNPGRYEPRFSLKQRREGGVKDGSKSLISWDSGWLRQKDPKFKDSLPYVTRSGLKKYKVK